MFPKLSPPQISENVSPEANQIYPDIGLHAFQNAAASSPVLSSPITITISEARFILGAEATIVRYVVEQAACIATVPYLIIYAKALVAKSRII